MRRGARVEPTGVTSHDSHRYRGRCLECASLASNELLAWIPLGQQRNLVCYSGQQQASASHEESHNYL